MFPEFAWEAVMHTAYSVAVIFFAVERGLAAVLPPGSRRCTKAMQRMFAAFEGTEATDFQTDANELGRTILRTRCGACSRQCKGRLR